MRRLIPAVALFLALAVSPAAGAERAMVRGTVLLGKTSSPAGGAEVTLIGARSNGTGRFYEESITADDRGRFSFAQVPAEQGAQFALEARYDGGLFVFDTMRLKTGVVEQAELRVFQTTSDPEVITVTRDHIFVAHDEQGAGVLESLTVVNNSERAYVGRGRSLGEGSSQTTLGIALPDQAIGGRVDLVDTTINRLYAESADFGFAATVAIPPGETKITFAYPAPGSGGSYDLSRRALYPIEEVSVFATEPLEITEDRLAYEGVEEISGVRYRKWSSREPFDAGDLIAIRAVAEGSSSSNLWLGMGIALGIVVLALVLALTFRSPRRPAAGRPSPARPAPAELVEAIAELDLRHESGVLSDEQWSEQRARLKDQLIAAKQREPAS